ncbi:MAG: pseudouridine synthase [Chitinophagaceae bacterium]|nr:MAG: pseudouridine synthase [Chitinophagaceae bacterium]
MPRYFSIHKPFNVLSQFTSQEGKHSLKDLFKFPVDAYPVGRLDYDSEGLLIITNDKSLNHKLLDPSFGHEREYWVQVDGAITSDALGLLTKGVQISIDGKMHHTKPAIASIFQSPPIVSDRNPPVRFRKNIPTSWISLTLSEGKNRQVRKMTAAAGFPTLRLIRYRIAGVTLDNMPPGAFTEWNRNDLFALLGL